MNNLIKFFLSPIFCSLFIFLQACSEPEPIKIAFIGTLSGKHSEVPISVRNATGMKIEQVNNSGGINGHKIQLDLFDNEGDQKQCAKEFDSILEKGYKFVVGPIFSHMAETTLHAIKGKDVLVMSPTMSTDYLAGLDDNLIRTASTNGGQARKISEHILANKWKNIGIVWDVRNKKYTYGIVKLVEETVKKYGVSVSIIESIDDETNLDLLTDSIKRSKPDALLTCLSAIDAAALAQKLTINKVKTKLLGVSWTQTNDLLEHGGRAVEGMVLISIGNKRGESFPAFEKEYISRYHQDPSFPIILGYNAISVLLAGMEKSKTLEPNDVKNTILKQQTFEGLDGPVTFDRFGDANRTFTLVKVVNNRYKQI